MLDLDREELRVGIRILPLRPKAFLLLAHFAQRPGCLITKDALVEVVWPDVVVTDDSLTQCVAQLRTALGDAEQRVIAARHPQRVASLVLYGPFARGRRAGYPSEQHREEAAVMRKRVSSNT